MTSTTVMDGTPWSDALLDQMRQQGDPPADAAVRQLFEEGSAEEVNRLMRTLVSNQDMPPAALPPVIRAYLEQTDDLPPWADHTLIGRGEELFCRYGLQMIMILNCYSLPLCYAAGKGVQVLYQTARLHTNAQRRIVETAQMVVDVMSPGGLGPGGAGIRSAQKVRLMHAAVRELIRERGWSQELGMPVNQEDMAGTLLTFSLVCVEGLRKLGVDIADDEAAAYLHAWNVVGHIMGLRPELMVRSVAEAQLLSEAISRRQLAPSPEGQAMMKALLDFMEYSIPGNLFDGFPASLTRFFVGDAVADALAVPPGDWTSTMLGPLRFFSALADDAGDQVVVFGKLASSFGRKLLEGLLWTQRGGERLPFSLPTELRTAWGLNG